VTRNVGAEMGKMEGLGGMRNARCEIDDRRWAMEVWFHFFGCGFEQCVGSVCCPPTLIDIFSWITSDWIVTLCILHAIQFKECPSHDSRSSASVVLNELFLICTISEHHIEPVVERPGFDDNL
jgi:hypothetical protein